MHHALTNKFLLTPFLLQRKTAKLLVGMYLNKFLYIVTSVYNYFCMCTYRFLLPEGLSIVIHLSLSFVLNIINYFIAYWCCRED